MNPSTDQVLTIRIATDQAAAAQTQNVLLQHEQTVRKVLTSYRDVEMASRKLRFVGAELAATGAAILAPLIASANEYARRYGQLETQSRNFLAAQQRQTDATANLGRVAAQALTPVMNQVADFTQSVAAFFQAHPDLLRLAVGVGGGLAAVGGVLVTASVIMSTVARTAELLQAVALLVSRQAGLSTGIGVGAAIAGGTVIGVGAAAALGVGGTHDVNEQLDRFVQILAAIPPGFEQIILTIGATFKNVVTFVGSVIQNFGVTLQKVAGHIEMIISQLMVAVSQAIRLIPGQGGAATALAGAAAGLGIDAANKITSAQYIDVSRLPILPTQEQQAQIKRQTDQLWLDVYNTLSSILQPSKVIPTGGANGANTPAANGTGLPPEAVNAYIAYRKAMVDTDRQFMQEEATQRKQYNDQELKAEQTHLNQLAEIDQSEHLAEIDAAAQYQKENEKALKQFNASEKQIQQRADLERLLRLQQHNLRLDQLAANRDVEGFINERDSYNQQEKAQSAQDDLEKKQRKEAFDQQQQERADQYKDEIDQLRLNAQRRKDQLNEQFRQEEQQRADAYVQQHQALVEKHRQEQTVLEQHYAEQLADLTQNVGGLHNIQTAFYAQATADAQNFVNTNRAILQQLYSATLNGSSGGSTPIETPGGSGTPFPVIPGSGITIGTFSNRSIPRDLTVGGQRQAVIQSLGSTRSGNQYHITVHNTVGDIATKSMLDGVVDEIIGGIRQAVHG